VVIINTFANDNCIQTKLGNEMCLVFFVKFPGNLTMLVSILTDEQEKKKESSEFRGLVSHVRLQQLPSNLASIEKNQMVW